MSNKNDKKASDYTMNEKDLYSEYRHLCLTEEDFYSPKDTRVLKSNIIDIYGGDNFADYCEEFFEMLEEEEYFDN